MRRCLLSIVLTLSLVAAPVSPQILLVDPNSDVWRINGRELFPPDSTHGEFGDQDNLTPFEIEDSGTDFQVYHATDLAPGSLDGWSFSPGGAGDNYNIISVGDSEGKAGEQILVTTDVAHGLESGDIVSHAALTDPEYVGIFEVVETETATTYEVTAEFTATDSGMGDNAATLECDPGEENVHQVLWFISASPEMNDETYDFALFKNSTLVVGSKVRRRFRKAVDLVSVAGGAVVFASEGDKISFVVSNVESSGDLVIRNFTLIVISI